MQFVRNRRHRPNLSEDLAAAVREMIFDGRLAAGARVNEVRLSAHLGVSRTPLREALAGLIAERALDLVPRRGYFVRELTREEVKNIYPIRAILDPEALRLSGIPSARRLEKLRWLGAKLARAADVETAIRLDEDWFRELWADCPNPVLLELIEQFMRRTHRYEMAVMRDRKVVTVSSEAKAEVVELLRSDRLGAACKRVRKTLHDGAKPVLEWLASRSGAS